MTEITQRTNRKWKKMQKIQVSIDFPRNVAKEYNPKLQALEYKLQLQSK